MRLLIWITAVTLAVCVVCSAAVALWLVASPSPSSRHNTADDEATRRCRAALAAIPEASVRRLFDCPTNWNNENRHVVGQRGAPVLRCDRVVNWEWCREHWTPGVVPVVDSASASSSSSPPWVCYSPDTNRLSACAAGGECVSGRCTSNNDDDDGPSKDDGGEGNKKAWAWWQWTLLAVVVAMVVGAVAATVRHHRRTGWWWWQQQPPPFVSHPGPETTGGGNPSPLEQRIAQWRAKLNDVLRRWFASASVKPPPPPPGSAVVVGGSGSDPTRPLEAGCLEHMTVVVQTVAALAADMQAFCGSMDAAIESAPGDEAKNELKKQLERVRKRVRDVADALERDLSSVDKALAGETRLDNESAAVAARAASEAIGGDVDPAGGGGGGALALRREGADVSIARLSSNQPVVCVTDPAWALNIVFRHSGIRGALLTEGRSLSVQELLFMGRSLVAHVREERETVETSMAAQLRTKEREFQEQLSRVKEKHVLDLVRQEQSAKAQQDELRKHLETEQREFDLKLQRMQTKHEEEIATQRENADRRERELQAQLAQELQHHDKMLQDTINDIEHQQKATDELFKEQEKTHLKRIEEIKEETDTERRSAALAAEERAVAVAEKQQNELKAKYTKELSNAREQHEKQIQELNRKMDDLKEEHERVSRIASETATQDMEREKRIHGDMLLKTLEEKHESFSRSTATIQLHKKKYADDIAQLEERYRANTQEQLQKLKTELEAQHVRKREELAQTLTREQRAREEQLSSKHAAEITHLEERYKASTQEQLQTLETELEAQHVRQREELTQQMTNERRAREEELLSKHKEEIANVNRNMELLRERDAEQLRRLQQQMNEDKAEFENTAREQNVRHVRALEEQEQRHTREMETAASLLTEKQQQRERELAVLDQKLERSATELTHALTENARNVEMLTKARLELEMALIEIVELERDVQQRDSDLDKNDIQFQQLHNELSGMRRELVHAQGILRNKVARNDEALGHAIQRQNAAVENEMVPGLKAVRALLRGRESYSAPLPEQDRNVVVDFLADVARIEPRLKEALLEQLATSGQRIVEDTLRRLEVTDARQRASAKAFLAPAVELQLQNGLFQLASAYIDARCSMDRAHLSVLLRGDRAPSPLASVQLASCLWNESHMMDTFQKEMYRLMHPPAGRVFLPETASSVYRLLAAHGFRSPDQIGRLLEALRWAGQTDPTGAGRAYRTMDDIRAAAETVVSHMSRHPFTDDDIARLDIDVMEAVHMQLRELIAANTTGGDVVLNQRQVMKSLERRLVPKEPARNWQAGRPSMFGRFVLRPLMYATATVTTMTQLYTILYGPALMTAAAGVAGTAALGYGGAAGYIAGAGPSTAAAGSSYGPLAMHSNILRLIATNPAVIPSLLPHFTPQCQMDLGEFIMMYGSSRRSLLGYIFHRFFEGS